MSDCRNYSPRSFNPSSIPADAIQVYYFYFSIPVIPSGNKFSHLTQLNLLHFETTVIET